jgi:hypothetical protein
MLTVHYFTLAAYAAGLVLTLVLASMLTPAAWWRHANARAAVILAGGTWGIASLILWLAQAPQPVYAASMPASPALRPAALAPAPAPKGGEYRTYRSLNVRSSTGTGAEKLAVLPAGAVVTATGVRSGDWWQVKTRVDGKPVSGWASSLWLRRADE